MPNISVDLPVPAGTGAGAWVDTSGLSPEKTIIVDNGPFTGQLFVELSNDGSASAVSVENVPIFQNNQVYPFTATLQFMRVRRVGGTGSPTVSVAGSPSTGNLFATLNVVNGGTGTSTDLSAGGDINTFEVSGSFTGNVFVELSDDGTDFSSSLLFTAAGSRTFLGPIKAVRVRTAGIVGSTPAVSVGSGSATASGSGQGVLNFDSISVIGRKLDEFDPTGYTPGATIAYVGNTFALAESVGDYFRLALDENVATPDGITVVTSPVEGLIWLRMMIPNQQFLAAQFWAIDDNASPENTGWGLTQIDADTHPIPSAELRRRLTGSSYDTLPIFHQLTDAVPAVWSTLDTVKTKNGNGFPIYLGTKTPQVAGTNLVITAVQVAVPATNTARSISAAGIGAGGFVGLMIQRTDGGKTAFATRSAAAGVMEIGEVRTSNAAIGDAGSVTDFIVGEHVTVFKLTTTPCHPFSGSEMFVGVGDTEISDPTPTVFEQGNMGGSYPFYTNCSFDGAVFGGGAFVFLGNVLFRLRQSIIEGGNLQFQTASAIGGGLQLTGNTNLVIGDEILVQNSSMVLSRGATCVKAGGKVGMFNCTGIPVKGTEQGSYKQTSGSIYGAGNINFLFDWTGASWEIFSGLATAVTTARAIDANGGAYNFADLPIVDTSSGTFGADRSVSARRISSLVFTGGILTSNGGATLSYMANPGSAAAAAAANQTLAQQFPTSKRQFEVLRVVKLVNGPPGVAVTVTLYKGTGGGAPASTLMTISMPAADPVGTRYSDSAHRIQFVDGDTIDLRLDAVLDAAPGRVVVSASLE